jgi:hypothetical protein
MIVFGGSTSSVDAPPAAHFNDIWFLTGTSGTSANLTWVKANPTGTPPSKRAGHSAVYDNGSNRMIVFGGSEGFAAPCDNDLGFLANANGVGAVPAWVPITASGPLPPARRGHGAVYNPSANIMIVFGGNDCSGTFFNDVWILTNANGKTTPTWTQLSPSGTLPPGRLGHGQVYDPATNRLTIFGGANGSMFFNDVWVLTNADGSGAPAWTQLFPLSSIGGPPCKREVPSAVYNSTSNSMIIFGGFCAAPMNDVWVLTNANGLGSRATWNQLTPAGTLPLGRFGHTAVYNPTNNRMTIFGGEVTPSGLSSDTVSVVTHADGT